MEMEEGSGGSQGQLIHPAVDVTKRARKRSRYLSPPYTDTIVQEKNAAGSHKQREEEEESPSPPHVSAAEVLSALRSIALWQGEGMDPAALRFLAMYRSNILVVDQHPDSHAAAGAGGNKPIPSVSAAGVGRKMLNLNAGPDDGSLARKNNPHPPAPAAVGANAKQQKDDGPMDNAAVLQHAIATHGHGHGHASQSPGFAATPTHGHPNPPPAVTTATSPANNEKRKMRRNKKRLNSIEQHSYVGNPVALVLDFAEGTPLPSREDLFSTFSRFGIVIDSETAISQDKRTARVAFATRDQAETALSCAATLGGGAFGPPFAVPSVQGLTLNKPLPKLPLTDIRNNLGKMILSLSSKATGAPQEGNAKTAVDSLSLVGEMQRLLAKVDRVLQVQRASATANHA